MRAGERPDPRPVLPGDAAAARALVEAEVGGTPYAEAPRATLDGALEGRAPEYRALVVESPEGLDGIALYGETAGAIGAGRLYLVAVTAGARYRGVGTTLVESAITDLARAGARFVLVEFPDDPSLAPGRALLTRAGFREESRVPDYFRDGVALTFLRRETP